ncbi:MAG: hypothetical protein V3U58_01460, partial [Thermodesulfobacteriota bacterium]
DDIISQLNFYKGSSGSAFENYLLQILMRELSTSTVSSKLFLDLLEQGYSQHRVMKYPINLLLKV